MREGRSQPRPRIIRRDELKNGCGRRLPRVLCVAVAGFCFLLMACGGGPVKDTSRCYEAPDWLARQIEHGLTAEGMFMERSFEHVFIVDNNDGRYWHFIGGAMYAPGMEGVIGVWATEYLKEPATLVAANTMAAEFSVWDKPFGGTRSFADKFNDEMATVQQCVRDAR